MGTVLAAVLIGVGVFEVLGGAVTGLWLAVIGWFVLEAGRAEERHVTTQDALGKLDVGRLMTLDPISVDASSSLAVVAAQLHGSSRHTSYPVVDDGVVVGLFPLRAFVDNPPADWGLRTVRQTMIPAGRVPVFAGSTPAIEAADKLMTTPVGRGLVFEQGELVGILSLTDVARALAMGDVV